MRESVCGWSLAFAGYVYHRCQNLNEALLGMSCVLSLPNSVHPEQSLLGKSSLLVVASYPQTQTFLG